MPVSRALPGQISSLHRGAACIRFLTVFDIVRPDAELLSNEELMQSVSYGLPVHRSEVLQPQLGYVVAAQRRGVPHGYLCALAQQTALLQAAPSVLAGCLPHCPQSPVQLVLAVRRSRLFCIARCCLLVFVTRQVLLHIKVISIGGLGQFCKAMCIPVSKMPDCRYVVSPGDRASTAQPPHGTQQRGIDEPRLQPVGDSA